MFADAGEPFGVDGLADGGAWPARIKFPPQLSQGLALEQQPGLYAHRQFLFANSFHSVKNPTSTSVNLSENRKRVNTYFVKNVEKSKRLREVRQLLRWDQAQMARELGLTRTYVSELENGKAPVQDYVLDRIEILAKRPEGMRGKLSENPHPLREDSSEYGAVHSIRNKCHAYLNQFLDICAADEARLHWTYVELQKHFPLSIWGAKRRPEAEASSRQASEGEEFLDEAEDDEHGRPPKSGR